MEGGHLPAGKKSAPEDPPHHGQSICPLVFMVIDKVQKLVNMIVEGIHLAPGSGDVIPTREVGKLIADDSNRMGDIDDRILR